MRACQALLLCLPLILAGAAQAAPNTSSGGQKCDESDSNVKHDIGGKHYTCDKCVYSQCDVGSSISNCKRVTEWTNCVAAAGSNSSVVPDRTKVDRMAPPKNTQKPGGAAGSTNKQ